MDPLADMANDDLDQNAGILEVSDGEPLDSDTSDMDDLDALIDGQNRSFNMSKAGNPPADNLDAFLTSEYCEEEKCPSLPPVSDTLAGIVTSWLCTAPKKEKVKELLKNVCSWKMLKVCFQSESMSCCIKDYPVDFALLIRDYVVKIPSSLEALAP